MGITKEITEDNIARFEKLMGEVKGPGVEQLMDYIRKSDFYTAPASTKHHLSVEGGLLQHSLNVYDCLMSRMIKNPTGEYQYIVAGNTVATTDHESLIIMALLHDICKTNFYTKGSKNQKTYDPDKVKKAERWQIKHDNMGDFIWETIETYEVDDKVPYGHGEKSVMMIEEFMKLTAVERYAIRWHMGYTDDGNKLTLGQAIIKYPLILALHIADQEASSFLEENTGNKFTGKQEKAEFQEAESI